MPSNPRECTALDESHRAGDELVSDSGNVCDLEVSGCKGDISYLGGSSPKDEQGQSALFEGNSPECAIVIANNQSQSYANHNNENHCEAKDIKDALNSELVGGLKSQDNGLRHRELSSAPSTVSTMSSIVAMKQLTQEANGDTQLDAHIITHQPQGTLNRKAEESGGFVHLETASRSSSDGFDTDEDTGNNRKQPTLKRKRSLSREWHTQSRSKGHLTHTTHSTSNKQRKSASQPRRSRGGGGADEKDEYEVEQITGVCLHRGKLSYTVHWTGWKVDWRFYPASNFKNSPGKLREFHNADSASPGPPVRLGEWEKCWAEDKTVEDHPDDNKPQDHM